MRFGWLQTSIQESKAKYAPLDRECNDDEDVDTFSIHRKGHFQTVKRLFQVFFIVQVILLPAGAALWYMRRQEPMNKYLKEVSSYSPLLNRINVPLTLRFDEPQTIDGGDGDMTWGAQPNPEIDKMWEELTTESVIPVTESEIVAMQKDPSVAVMLPEQYHLGNEKTYLAHALVFHQLHCLNYIRKALYKNYYYPNGTDEVPMHEHHIAHCIAMVLDHITCAGDPGVYYVPLPDANTWGKCWDFNGFRKEFDKIALTDLNPLEMLKPPGVKSVTEHNNLQEIAVIYMRQSSVVIVRFEGTYAMR
ncbi:tat pathway signal sequence protein [Colletotrichum incanum]|uniref:Tat pathway signal sequence protein n=1 Tax=Colletotrichum incanum TaxID=1573173 RepID=A0A167CJ06_COLIC|nr:tat pathway signal sequence protein [Colletotrichum incanum]